MTQALRPIEELLSRRVVLVTGKGGVGRSSVTAALATVAAGAGKRVLVTEIGDTGAEESPLARIFGIPRLPGAGDPEEISVIAPGILGTLLVSPKGQELFLRSVLPVPALAKAALGSEALRRLLSAAPSFREMGVFFHLLTLLKAKRRDGSIEHELILVDMPATGHALALTGLPDVLLGLVSRGPIAQTIREGQAYLNDPRTGAAYVVTLPEALPVSETLELLAGLTRTHMPVGGVILNRMPQDPFSPAEREALRPLVDDGRLLGAGGFRRVEEAAKSLDRLRREVAVPILQIPEQAPGVEGPVLRAAMAVALDAREGYR